jgi:hypothetical protein
MHFAGSAWEQQSVGTPGKSAVQDPKPNGLPLQKFCTHAEKGSDGNSKPTVSGLTTGAQHGMIEGAVLQHICADGKFVDRRHVEVSCKRIARTRLE